MAVFILALYQALGHYQPLAPPWADIDAQA